MSIPPYSIHRNGNLFKIGNDQVGYKTFRLKVFEGEDTRGIDEAKMEEISSRIFSLLQDSHVAFKSLANTKVTAEGITTDQKETGKVSLISGEDLPEFNQKFGAMSKIAGDALSKKRKARDKSIMKKREVVKKDETPSEEVKSAIKATGETIKKSFWPSFVMKIYEFFEKIFSPGKFKARHTKFATHLVSRSSGKVEALKDFRLKDVSENPDVAKFGELGSKFVYVPEGILMTPDERNAELRSKEIGADVAISEQHQRYKVVSPLDAGGITVKGYKINSTKPKEKQIREDRVIPTSFKMAKGKKSKRNRLMNCYMAAPEGHGLLRTGVVDTKEKAKEFLIAARKLHEEIGGYAATKDRPLRIVSHQLNSPEVESAMIRDQHKNLAALSHESGDVEILHLNTPCNRFYDTAKSLEKKGLYLFQGEEKSRHQNIEGMARYLIWLVEDLERLSKDPSLSVEQRHRLVLAAGKLQSGTSNKIYQLRNKVNQINEGYHKLQKKQDELKEKKKEKSKIKLSMGLMTYFGEKMKANAEIGALEQEIDSISGSINSLREELFVVDDENGESKGALLELYKSLKDTIEANVLTGDDPIIAEQRTTIMLFRKLLGNQYRFESVPKGELMERGQELIAYQLLNKRLGVISAVNCKSGLDRTGFMFALMMGLTQCPENVRMDIALNWDKYSAALNRKMKELNYDTAKLYQWLEEPENSSFKDVYRTILDFRLNVFNNLLNVSLPITAISTGLFGLKWGRGMQENLIPLNFIPPVVQVVHEDGHLEQVRILNYSGNGKVKGLTPMGHRLLTQLSPRRGA